MNQGWFFELILGLVVCGWIWAATRALRMHSRWKTIPTLPEYLAQHPECKSNNGIRCSRCGSGSIRNWGVVTANDARRTFICNHCGRSLYRSA